jgi:hypothetical protein
MGGHLGRFESGARTGTRLALVQLGGQGREQFLCERSGYTG